MKTKYNAFFKMKKLFLEAASIIALQHRENSSVIIFFRMFIRPKLIFEEKVKIHVLARARVGPSLGPGRAWAGPGPGLGPARAAKIRVRTGPGHGLGGT